MLKTINEIRKSATGLISLTRMEGCSLVVLLLAGAASVRAKAMDMMMSGDMVGGNAGVEVSDGQIAYAIKVAVDFGVPIEVAGEEFEGIMNEMIDRRLAVIYGPDLEEEEAKVAALIKKAREAIKQ